MIGFVARWVLAFGLLSATYNPTRWNYFTWVQDKYDVETPLAVLFGLVLLAGYIVYLRATLRSIGLIGIGLVAAIVGAMIWVLMDQGVLALDSTDLKIWATLLGLSFVLGTGLSWSHVRRAISGQSDMDDLGD
ncbi:MAG: DUF6524 family protein [Paracoccaceae bacterium]